MYDINEFHSSPPLPYVSGKKGTIMAERTERLTQNEPGFTTSIRVVWIAICVETPHQISLDATTKSECPSSIANLLRHRSEHLRKRRRRDARLNPSAMMVLQSRIKCPN